MENGWCHELQDKGMMQEIIDFMETERIVSASAFANYIDAKNEIMPLIIDKVPAAKGRRDQKTVLSELWRQAEADEALRVQRKAGGVKADDMEDPLPDGAIDQFRSKCKAFYNFELNLKEVLCEPLMARMKREIDRKIHTMIPIERVRTARETARTSAGKKLQFADDITVSFGV